MNKAKKVLIRILILVVLLAVAVEYCRNYSVIMSKTIVGEVTGAERVASNTIIAQPGTNPEQFSFAVAIRTHEGQIYTASSEDRQWAVVQKGQCVEARYYPYPFWDFEKSGTWFNARLLRVFDCPK